MGIFRGRIGHFLDRGAHMSQPKSKHITWSHSHVSRDERAKLLGHGAATVWFTGLSGSDISGSPLYFWADQRQLRSL